MIYFWEQGKLNEWRTKVFITFSYWLIKGSQVFSIFSVQANYKVLLDKIIECLIKIIIFMVILRFLELSNFLTFTEENLFWFIKMPYDRIDDFDGLIWKLGLFKYFREERIGSFPKKFFLIWEHFGHFMEIRG